MKKRRYFYQAGAMNMGNGYYWHKFYNFPKLPLVTKTITYNSKVGFPFAVLRFGKSTWNKIALNNKGFDNFLFSNFRDRKELNKTIISLYGSLKEVQKMIDNFEYLGFNLGGIELNYSCPNVEQQKYTELPNTFYKLYLKLRYDQDPYKFNLDKIERIHLNTIPKFYGGVGGKLAQKKNWDFIKRFLKEGIEVAGSSWVDETDLKMLDDMGVRYFGIGSAILVNPKLIERLNYGKN